MNSIIGKVAMAKRLTVAGLLPMFAVPLFLIYTKITGYKLKEPEIFLFFFQAYLAVILSFLGGINWGMGLKSEDPAGEKIIKWSILSPLLGWAALILGTYAHIASLALFSALFLAQVMIDNRHFRNGVFDEWFIKLRKFATGLVIISIALMMLAYSPSIDMPAATEVH